MAVDKFHVNWNYPTQVRMGLGRISELPALCQELKISSPLLVTDPGLASLPMTRDIQQACKAQQLNCGIFSDIKSNPNGENIQAGVEHYKSGGYDGIIAFGGGSALDAGKAIALMVGQNRPLWDFEDLADNYTRVQTQEMAPVIAIPTTSGTGSEVGRASVITDSSAKIKRIIFHPRMMPEVVLLDPLLTIALPAPITAATGMDALSHSLEAYCAVSYHPMAEGIALEGIRLVKENLITAYLNGEDQEARANMSVASLMGATAFQRGLGAMHALAHPLGALYDSHHGRLNAILMPYVLNANRTVIESSITRLASYIGLEDISFNGFMDWIVALRQKLGIENTLKDIGIDDKQSALVGEMAAVDPSAGGNPISFNVQEYRGIFENALNGRL